MNVIITNPLNLKELKKELKEEGSEKIHVLSDFDKTLTCAFVDGEKTPSLISILRDGNYLTPDYAEKAHALFDKYHPIEIDPGISLEEKKKAMHEWWKTHFDLLIKCGLKKKDIEDVVNSNKVKFRESALELINLLYKNNIPLVIISSSGLGKYALELLLKKHNSLYDNVYIISNDYIWDENGKAIDVKEPIIHCMNKDETVLDEFPFYKEIEKRRNVVLLGDSLADIDMVQGFDYKHLLKIGFLNEKVEELLPEYKKRFDVIIPNDGSMGFVLELMREILSQPKPSQ